MALGRQCARQTDLILSWAELPRLLGHAFYDRLQAEGYCARFSTVFVRSLNCLPHARQRNLR